MGDEKRGRSVEIARGSSLRFHMKRCASKRMEDNGWSVVSGMMVKMLSHLVTD